MKFVYTFSSTGNLFEYTLHSVKSLLQFVDPESVRIYYTPPRNKNHTSTLRGLGVDVRHVEPITEPFGIMPFDEPSHYGEKTRVCEVEDDEVVFLDSDTLVLGDIWPMLEGGFDVKARPSTYQPGPEDWRSSFDGTGYQPLNWMPNTGFLVFKNGVHRDIKNGWRELLAHHNRPTFRGMRLDDQWALAGVLGEGFDIVRMNRCEHTIEWDETPPGDGVVYHLDTDKKLTVEKVIESPLGTATEFVKNKLFR